jgi:hypothetical protein
VRCAVAECLGKHRERAPHAGELGRELVVRQSAFITCDGDDLALAAAQDLRNGIKQRCAMGVVTPLRRIHRGARRFDLACDLARAFL